jgi:hypothetical protein
MVDVLLRTGQEDLGAAEPVDVRGRGRNPRSNPMLEATVAGSWTTGLVTSLYVKLSSCRECWPWETIELRDAVPLEADHKISKPQAEERLAVKAETRCSTFPEGGVEMGLQAERAAAPAITTTNDDLFAALVMMTSSTDRDCNLQQRRRQRTGQCRPWPQRGQ